MFYIVLIVSIREAGDSLRMRLFSQVDLILKSIKAVVCGNNCKTNTSMQRPNMSASSIKLKLQWSKVLLLAPLFIHIHRDVVR